MPGVKVKVASSQALASLFRLAAPPLPVPVLSHGHHGPPRRPTPSTLRYRRQGQLRLGCAAARRRVIRYDEEEEGEYGHNSEIAALESYSEGNKTVALLVRANVDEEEGGGREEEVIIFKGFSSSLSSGTAWDPSKSVLPTRAVITSIDVVKAPFDPSNIEYLERNLTWEDFSKRLGLPKQSC